MKASGCYSVAFGIESGSQEILDRIEKKTNLEKVRKAVEMASAAGLITQGFFIFGLPGETPETIDQTIRFAMSLHLHKAQFLLLDVLPGTRIWDDLGGMPYIQRSNSQHGSAGTIHAPTPIKIVTVFVTVGFIRAFLTP